MFRSICMQLAIIAVESWTALSIRRKISLYIVTQMMHTLIKTT